HRRLLGSSKLRPQSPHHLPDVTERLSFLPAETLHIICRPVRVGFRLAQHRWTGFNAHVDSASNPHLPRTVESENLHFRAESIARFHHWVAHQSIPHILLRASDIFFHSFIPLG
ncbi:hypothetical protein PMAYCL1PPCAC_15197, partial [Pristionchus mayeri]